MRIAFNGLRSGLGNNGGSRTILLCKEELEKLGHRCDVLAVVDNFTWFDHEPALPCVPKDLDAVIAVSCVDVPTTVMLPVPKKAWYIRAHETWSMRPEILGAFYNEESFLNIVNSYTLKHKLKEYGANSVVVHQGMDFDWWEDRQLRPKDKIRIGCLFTEQPRKRWKDFVKLATILGTCDYEYVAIGNSVPSCDFLSHFSHNANIDELVNLYSSCHIWFAPTDSEGLHNPPMEAALCGCLIVCSNHPLNGMVLDYAFNDTAAIYDFGNIEQAAEIIRNPDWNLVPAMQEYINKNIGNRKDNMQKLVNHLENML